MNKLYTLIIAGSMLLAGALSSPAEARDHKNWRNNNRSCANNNWNRAAFVRQQQGGTWVNAQIAADREYALRFSPQAQAAQNPYLYQQLNNQFANPYIYQQLNNQFANPYIYQQLNNQFANPYANVNQFANPYNGNFNNFNNGLLNRILGRF
jgi:hypothetical protein